MMSKLIRISTAARYLGVTTVTVRRWIHKGWLQGFRVGPQLIKVSSEDIQRLRSIVEKVEKDISGQVDTRLGVILQGSRVHTGIQR